MIPQSIVDEIRSRADLVSLIRDDTSVVRTGSSWMARCPFHDDRTPSMSVDPVKGLYHCHGCGASGDAISYIMRRDGQSFGDSVRTLGRAIGVDVPADKASAKRGQADAVHAVNDVAARYWQGRLSGDDAAAARAYLGDRGISDETSAAFGIGYAPAAWEALASELAARGMTSAACDAALLRPRKSGGVYDVFRDRIMLPMHDSAGNVIGFTGRLISSTESGKSPKYLTSSTHSVFRKSRTLYMHRGRIPAGADRIVLVEGHIDAIVLWQRGYHAVSVMGSAITDHQVAMLARMRLPVVIAFDGDSAGRDGAAVVSRRLAAADVDVSIAHIPDGEDPASVSSDDIAQLISEATQGTGPPVLSSMDLPPWVTDLIRSGCTSHDVPAGDPVLGAACALVRAGAPHMDIASILLDDQYGISGHARSQIDPDQYVRRQIGRATDYCESPYLMQLNDTHAVIESYGGSCRIMEEVHDDHLGRARIVMQSFTCFRNRYCNKMVQVGETAQGRPKMSSLGKWWTEHPRRRQYSRVVFLPGETARATDAYNLWRGFAVRSVQGDCSRILEHIHEVICDGDVAHYNYLLGWLARCVQLPAEQGRTAVVMRGDEGAGKGLFCKYFGSLWGRHYWQLTQPQHLVGAFNVHLRDVIVLFADEAFFAGDKRGEGVLKGLITEDSLVIEPKHVDAEVAPNYLHLLMASNSEWVVPAGGTDRRYFVLDVSGNRIKDAAYWDSIVAERDSGGKEALLWYLQHYDISEFDVRALPKTQGLIDQKLLSMSPLEEWWFRRLNEGRLTAGATRWTCHAPRAEMIADYLSYGRQIGESRRSTATAIGMYLRKLLGTSEWPKVGQRTVSVTSEDQYGHPRTIESRPYCWIFPGLDQCREAWEARYNGSEPFPWESSSSPMDE